MKEVDLVIAGDLHITSTPPRCRTDDYIQAQWRKIEFIYDLCDKYDCYAVFPGDICHTFKLEPWVERKAIRELPPFIGTVGQHDVPYHNTDNYNQSSLAVIEAGMHDDAIVLNNRETTVPGNSKELTLHGYSWGRCGEVKSTEPDNNKTAHIGIMHKTTWTTRVPYPGCKADSAQKLLMKYPDYNLIITGDNHQHFTVKHKGRLLVNCGSVMRSEADQVNHTPCVYLYSAKDNTIEKVLIPIKKDVIDRKHIELKEHQDQMNKAYIQNLKSNERPVLNFKKNLKTALEGARQDIKDIVNKSLYQ